MSLTSETPSSIPWDRLMGFLNIPDLLKLRRLSHDVSDRVDCYIGNEFTYRKLFNRHFSNDETTCFRHIHQATGLLASGILIASFLCRQPIRLPHLKLFVVSEDAGCLIAFLRHIGYVCIQFVWREFTSDYKPLLTPAICSPFIRGDILAAEYPGGTVENRVNFSCGESNIEVYVCRKSPVQAILQSVSTSDTIFFTASEVHCPFPRSLLKENVNYSLRTMCKGQSWCDNASRLYQNMNWPAVEHTDAIVAASFDFHPFPRYFGDPSSFVLQFADSVRWTTDDNDFHTKHFNIAHLATAAGMVMSTSAAISVMEYTQFYAIPRTPCFPTELLLIREPFLLQTTDYLRMESDLYADVKRYLRHAVTDTISCHRWRWNITERPTLMMMIACLLRCLYTSCYNGPESIQSLEIDFKQRQHILYAVATVMLDTYGRDNHPPNHFPHCLLEEMRKRHVEIIYKYTRSLRIAGY
ncbi:hypothetical protein K435DRAFT_867241 [Dendrothele bispora CBS 962.96]|uniref:Uncharacterized protein n=1 Tax=Dendrothele bispora (strain CBS 962.96) TaxID=1314807 RepID=A0A4S8LEY6_DENBC|nr:hypothetical protein K435DRAFT_867241 [Dendrothele bispora CBS 962.96]